MYMTINRRISLLHYGRNCLLTTDDRQKNIKSSTINALNITPQLHTFNFINVPNLVSLAQNFLEPEDPSRIKIFGPGACSLNPTRTVTRKAYRLGQNTCDLQVREPAVPFVLPAGAAKEQKVQNTCTCTPAQ